ncbi:P-loop containing nucleoside triphosphate hydrolase protein [Dendrothele bispora CBS 962.96]|uniref:P-loop containing nucleoside triphosphate hydrolase protein n=1 Tax=Dendrothele bispora (strain CBS 962.96) TaxID=1314807 RepID=A0A4S8M724_DENBC|nr:P-loop containing nucleoside triphosphate hydrolase protein [Dendrothele bispora CBS 962.96]
MAPSKYSQDESFDDVDQPYDSDSDSESEFEPSTSTPNGGQEDDVVIAVMGSTGTGKSSFIRLLTGDTDVAVGDSLESETSEVKVVSYRDPESGRNVKIVDTPGFDDSRAGVSDTDILKSIAEFLVSEYDKNRKLNGLVYVHRISDPRFSGQSNRNLRMFRELCGTQNYKNVIVLTTFWDRTNDSEGQKREKQLRTKFCKDLVDGGAHFMRHDRTVAGARHIVQEILPMPPTNVQLQKEIREEGKSLEDTAAGSVHREEVERLIAKHKKEVEDLKAEMRDIARSNEEARRELKEEKAKLKLELQRWEKERSELQKGLDEEKSYRKQMEETAAKEKEEWNNRFEAQSKEQAAARKDTEDKRRQDETAKLLEEERRKRLEAERALDAQRKRTFVQRGKDFAADAPFVPTALVKPALVLGGRFLDLAKGVKD